MSQPQRGNSLRGKTLIALVGGLLVTILAAFGQTNPFPLATTGCAQDHCAPTEDGAIGIVPPTAMTGGICSTGPCIGKVHYSGTGGATLSPGCTSNGSSRVACKSDTSPRLTVYNASGTSILYTSCSSLTPTTCSHTVTDACGTSVNDLLDSNAGPALVGSDNTIIVADDKRIYRFNSDGTQNWYKCLPAAASGYAPYGTVLTNDGSGIENVTLLTQHGPVMTFRANDGAVVTTQGATYFSPMRTAIRTGPTTTQARIAHASRATTASIP